jgi:hypothetical protein
MAHLRACCRGPFGHQFEANRGAAVRAFGTERSLVDGFVLMGGQPHQLKTFWTATDLRCHGFPRTLAPNMWVAFDRAL